MRVVFELPILMFAVRSASGANMGVGGGGYFELVAGCLLLSFIPQELLNVQCFF